MPRFLTFLIVGVGVVFLSGCPDPEDKVTTYSASRDGVVERVRLLAAVIPQAEAGKTWFVKLSGPKETIGKEQEHFQSFVGSLRFTGKTDPALTWTLPEGWKQDPGQTQHRYATILVGDKDPLEATISSLEGQAGTLVLNVNRWRGQIGLDAIDDLDLDLFTRKESLPLGPVTFVDMVGPGKDDPDKGGMGGDIRFVKPDGWEAMPPDAKGFYVLGFKVSDGGKSAETTITSFPGPAGGLEDNVRRWQRQIGMEEWKDDARFAKEAQALTVSGVEGKSFDLTGPPLGDRGKERILGVVVAVGGQTWFVKMKGPADLVGQQKRAFEDFAKALRLPGVKGGKK